MCAYKLTPGPLCAREKERSEMKGHEAREDMKRKRKKKCVKGKRERVKREPNGGDGNP